MLSHKFKFLIPNTALAVSKQMHHKRNGKLSTRKEVKISMLDYVPRTGVDPIVYAGQMRDPNDHDLDPEELDY